MNVYIQYYVFRHLQCAAIRSMCDTEKRTDRRMNGQTDLSKSTAQNADLEYTNFEDVS